jgi:hypothetical protein
MQQQERNTSSSSQKSKKGSKRKRPSSPVQQLVEQLSSTNLPLSLSNSSSSSLNRMQQTEATEVHKILNSAKEILDEAGVNINHDRRWMA